MTAELVTPAVELLTELELDHYYAVAIYPLSHPQGEPVAWLELLSLTNKLPHSDSYEYQMNIKRSRPKS